MGIPVYIFTGLLEGGKTTFMKEVLSDPNFTEKERTLIVQLEEGIEEFDDDFLKKFNCSLIAFEDIDDVTIAALKKAVSDNKADRVMVELNGMWNLSEFVDECMPANWELYQVVAAINGSTFELYSANLGQRMFEHITNADLIVFNRCTQKDKDYLHSRNIRAMNPRATIFLDDVDGNSEDYRDNMVMPFDINADEIAISDEDFGLWYVDASSQPEKYEGKIVKFKSHVFISDKLPKGLIFTGRHGMVCCADDIAYLGFVCQAGDKFDQIKSKEWYNITAKIHIEELSIYKGAGPVLTLLDIEKANPPKDEIVYFN